MRVKVAQSGLKKAVAKLVYSADHMRASDDGITRGSHSHTVSSHVHVRPWMTHRQSHTGNNRRPVDSMAFDNDAVVVAVVVAAVVVATLTHTSHYFASAQSERGNLADCMPIT